MGGFRSGRRGQFVVLAAVIVAAFMFSLIVTVNQISVIRQEVSYEPVDELVLAVTSDFERCLIRALAIATQNYSETWNLSLAKMAGEELIEEWKKALPESYGGLGLNILLASENVSDRGIGWEITWDRENGGSMIYTTFAMEIGRYGLKGLVVTIPMAVFLNIQNVSINSSGGGSTLAINFQVSLSDGRGNAIPIPDLTENSLKLFINRTAYGSNITDFEYLGQGKYRAVFNLEEENLVVESVTLLVVTRDGIRVAATKNLQRVGDGGSSGGGGTSGDGGSSGGGGVSNDENWRVIYISPWVEEGRLKREFFTLKLDPGEPEQITPPLNNPNDKRSGNTTETTPALYLGENVSILLYARYTKKGKEEGINVKVTLGFYDADGAFHGIGEETVRIYKSADFRVYKITFQPNVQMIPEGSRITLIFERVDNNSGGTLQILCGQFFSRIELW
ncbi:MAG: hypothetical protein QXR84_06515 [Candidatus Bathyarchaeia archaeon]|nr:hypothetical protein [Candidatus Bathyarchaeota archaeon]